MDDSLDPAGCRLKDRGRRCRSGLSSDTDTRLRPSRSGRTYRTRGFARESYLTVVARSDPGSLVGAGSLKCLPAWTHRIAADVSRPLRRSAEATAGLAES